MNKKLCELNKLKLTCEKCQACTLYSLGRTQTVFGQGDPDARIFLVGEGPGRQEDEQGVPFVGRAGTILNEIILESGLDKTKIYISNVVKCRPPNNKTPTIGQSQTCAKLFLFNEIMLVAPKIICALGQSATQILHGPKTKLSNFRGTFGTFYNILTMTTYHPAYILRNLKAKEIMVSDFKLILEKL